MDTSSPRGSFSPVHQPLLARRRNSRKNFSEKNKEILSWAKKRNIHGASNDEESLPASGGAVIDSRKVGLSVNVTESRLLDTHLLDLSRERYQRLQEKMQQKNHFIDNQIRKSKSLPQLLEGINIQQYRQKSFNGVELFKERSHRMKVMLIREHFKEFLQNDSEESLLQMELQDIFRLVEVRRGAALQQAARDYAPGEKAPEVQTAGEDSGQTRLLSAISTSSPQQPTTPVSPIGTSRSRVNFSMAPREVLQLASPDGPAGEENMGVAAGTLLSPPALLNRQRSAPLRTVRSSSIQRLQMRRQSAKQLRSDGRQTPGRSNVDDPRCTNLMMTLVPFSAQGCRPASGKTLPCILAHIDSLQAEAAHFPKVKKPKHSDKQSSSTKQHRAHHV